MDASTPKTLVNRSQASAARCASALAVALGLALALTGCPKEPDEPTAEDRARHHYLQGRAWMEADNLPKAKEAMEAAAALDPSRAAVHFALGQIQMARRELVGAEASFRKALALQDERMHWIGLGRVLAAQQRPEAAIEAFRSALARSPDDPEAHFLVAKALAAMGKIDAAAETYAKARDLQTVVFRAAVQAAGVQDGELGCAALPDTGDAPQSERGRIHLLNVACAEREGALRYALALGEFYEGHARWTDAAEAYAAAEALRPGDTDLLSLLGGARVRAGDLPGALEIYRRLAEREEKVWTAVRADVAPALALYEAAGGDEGRIRHAANTLAWEAWRQASARYNLSVERADGAALAASLSWELVGGVHRALDRPDEALQAFRRALDIRPDSPGGWEALGRLHLAEGRQEEARAAALRALEGDWPDDASHRRLLTRLADLLAATGEAEKSAAAFRWLAGQDDGDPALWWRAARESHAAGDAAWTHASCDRVEAARAAGTAGMDEAAAWCAKNAPAAAQADTGP